MNNYKVGGIEPWSEDFFSDFFYFYDPKYAISMKYCTEHAIKLGFNGESISSVLVSRGEVRKWFVL
jgi:hypothetical protein